MLAVAITEQSRWRRARRAIPGVDRCLTTCAPWPRSCGRRGGSSSSPAPGASTESGIPDFRTPAASGTATRSGTTTFCVTNRGAAALLATQPRDVSGGRGGSAQSGPPRAIATLDQPGEAPARRHAEHRRPAPAGRVAGRTGDRAARQRPASLHGLRRPHAATRIQAGSIAGVDVPALPACGGVTQAVTVRSASRCPAAMQAAERRARAVRPVPGARLVAGRLPGRPTPRHRRPERGAAGDRQRHADARSTPSPRSSSARRPGTVLPAAVRVPLNDRLNRSSTGLLLLAVATPATAVVDRVLSPQYRSSFHGSPRM